MTTHWGMDLAHGYFAHEADTTKVLMEANLGPKNLDWKKFGPKKMTAHWGMGLAHG